MRLLFRQGLRHHLRHPLQTLLTGLGIAAGVALLCAMRLGQNTAERAFDRALVAVAGEATHVVRGGPDGIPVAAYAAVRRDLGGAGVAPTIQAVARVPSRAERTVLRVLGVDPLADVALRPWAGAGEPDLPLGALLTRPGAFVATRELLRRLGVTPGAELAITVGARPFAARCVGVLSPPALVAAGLQDTLLVDVATAQEWTGRLDRVDRLDLRLEPKRLPRGVSVAAAVERVGAICGPGCRVETAGASAGGLASLARGFRVNLTALSLLSLLVGAFLAHETMRLSVVARRRSFGVLCALGAPARAIGAVVVAEAALLGLIGSACGALLGALAAQLLLQPIVRTLNDHYATFSIAAVELDPWQLLLAISAGVGATVLAGLGPAVAAARVPAREVLVAHEGGPARAWPLWWCVPPAALGAVLLATVGDRLAQGYLGMLCLLLAVVAAMPAAMAAFLAGVAACLRRLGPFVRYVVRSTAAARSHLALPLAAMVLAVATTIGMAMLVTSFRASVAGWLGTVLPGDIYVSVPGGVDEKDAPIEPVVVAALREAPGVAGATVYHRARFWLQAGSGEGRIEVVGVEPTPAFVAAFPLLNGDDEGGRGALTRGDGCWVSEPLAFRWGLAVGRSLTITTARGPQTLPIAAIYRDYSNERGEVLVGSRWLQERSRVEVTALGLEVAAGADVDAVVVALAQRAAAVGEQAVQVRSQLELKTTSLAIFDRTFAITSVMRLLCLVVAFIGIYAAFAALQLERGGEIGLLRCLGAVPARIAMVVIGQTLLLGVTAGALAVPVGIGVGHLLAQVVNRVSFGWSLVTVEIPWVAVGEAFALAVIAALLAGVQPALQFARMRPAAALREA